MSYRTTEIQTLSGPPAFFDKQRLARVQAKRRDHFQRQKELLQKVELLDRRVKFEASCEFEGELYRTDIQVESGQFYFQIYGVRANEGQWPIFNDDHLKLSVLALTLPDLESQVERFFQGVEEAKEEVSQIVDLWNARLGVKFWFRRSLRKRIRKLSKTLAKRYQSLPEITVENLENFQILCLKKGMLKASGFRSYLLIPDLIEVGERYLAEEEERS